MQISIDPDEELIITGSDILYLMDGINSIVEESRKWGLSIEAENKLSVRLLALVVGIIKIMPMDARQKSIEMFEKDFGIEFKKLFRN